MRTTPQTTVIAEAGVNHNGDLHLAKKLVDAAVDAGADVVKFQTFQASQLNTYAQQAVYQKKSLDKSESQLQMLKRFELQPQDYSVLTDYCQQRNIEFLSTAFDIESIDLITSLKLKRLKVPSGEITNLPYLRHIASKGKPVILSSGMSNLSDIESALIALENSGLSWSDHGSSLHN